MFFCCEIWEQELYDLRTVIPLNYWHLDFVLKAEFSNGPHHLKLLAGDHYKDVTALLIQLLDVVEALGEDLAEPHFSHVLGRFALTSEATF